MEPACLPRVIVIGGGLAGSLVALALARRGTRPHLVDAAGSEVATALSYGSLQGFAAARRWRALQRRHGDLGWRSSAVVLHRLENRDPTQADGGPTAAAAAPDEGRQGLQAPLLPVPLPFSRLDVVALSGALPAVLAAAGVVRLVARVETLTPLAAMGWRMALADGSSLQSERVVLAAGPGCRALWPALPERLQTSWAGVLRRDHRGGSSRWLEAVRRGWMVFPAGLRRPALERSQDGSGQPRWCVDVGMAPWGEGMLAGQISWLPGGSGQRQMAHGPWRDHPGEATSDRVEWSAGTAGPPAVDGHLDGGSAGGPDPAWMEQRLRRALARLDPALAELDGEYRQVPVSYCRDGVPLAGAVAPGLWALAGCSNAFSHLPALAERLAVQVLTDPA